MRRAGVSSAVLFLALAVVAHLGVARTRADEATLSRVIPLDQLRSGSTFVTPETRAQQDDLTVNPGMLWVEQGEKLWSTPPDGAEGKSCAGCHQAPESMKGVAARYPQVDAKSGKVLTLEDRINQCRTDRQGAQPLAEGSDERLALASVVAHQSRGLPLKVASDGPAVPHLAAGRALYYARQGQLNLSCANCHEQSWGKRLRNETISQGHPNGYPTYRLEWQTLGSLQRRIKACYLGVHAEPLPVDGDEFRDLALYLAWRAEGLTIETPAVRR